MLEKLKFLILYKDYFLYLILIKNDLVFYLVLPKCVSIIKSKQNILFSASYFKLLISFKLKLTQFFRMILKPYKKSVILKGLGLKVTKIKNFLEFKLGFSHLCLVKIPEKFISININKNMIISHSFNLLILNNFVYKLRNLKIPSTYKGKGIWLKNEVKKIKIIKKA